MPYVLGSAISLIARETTAACSFEGVPSTRMRIVRTPPELADLHGGVFVPTMGALHEGHFALVRDAVRIRSTLAIDSPVVVSIFVNPTQFNDPADLARYPRTLELDAAGCAAAGADCIFAPESQTIYPLDQTIPVPALPDVATRPGLEDAHRPGHFAGVCQVVHRLFDLVRPAAAVFGEKDWQQLQVIKAMTSQDRLPIRIFAAPTVREADGLAMSSRNVFLSLSDRARAVSISRALRKAAQAHTISDAEVAMHDELVAHGLQVEYAVIRHANTLMPLIPGSSSEARALIAARCGPVRLIDNAPWTATAM